jgi:hypothetical protein
MDMLFGGRNRHGQNPGEDKVIAMDRFRSGKSLSPIRQAEAYWTGLRKGSEVPFRSQIDPRGLENILSQTFILERIAPGIARFRLAGQKLNEMAGMEVRGMPLSAFFTPAARSQLSAALEHMFDAPAIVELSLATESSRLRGPQEARMILLPLRSDLGEISRVLGVFVSDGNPTRTSQRFNITATELRPVPGAETVRPTEATKPVNQPNPGFAETQAKFGEERSVLEEARALVESQRRRGAPEKAANPAKASAEDAKSASKRAPHLRLVVSRD